MSTPSPNPLDNACFREDWVRRAACRDLAPEIRDLFFPERGENASGAIAICGGCPVRRECLDFALRNHEDDGIWGGCSGRERRRMRRGTEVRFAQCRYCRGLFSFAGELNPSLRQPTYCSDTCRHESRRLQKQRARRTG